ncbi:hypothetical protein ACQ5SK_09950 [Bradyrhizobium japonicum]
MALPSPECWVTISPGTASSASPGRAKGRALISSPEMVISLAMLGWAFAPEATLRASDACVAAGETTMRSLG